MNNIEENKKAIRRTEDSIFTVKNNINREINEASKKERKAAILSYITFGISLAITLPTVNHFIGVYVNGLVTTEVIAHSLGPIAVAAVSALVSGAFESKKNEYNDQICDALDDLDYIEELEDGLDLAKEALKAQEQENKRQERKFYTYNLKDDFSINNNYQMQDKPKTLRRIK